MKDKLLKLHDYLLSNGYIKDADRIYSILEEYENENKLSDLSAQKLIAMCNPKYLGNYYIREFDDLYNGGIFWLRLFRILDNNFNIYQLTTRSM